MIIGREIVLAIKRIWRRKWLSIVCIVMFAFSIGFLTTVIALRSLTIRAEKDIKGVLSDSIEQYGFLDMDYFVKEEEIIEQYGSMNDFFDEINNLPCIKSIGYLYGGALGNFCDDSGNMISETIAAEQNKHSRMYRQEQIILSPEELEAGEQIVEYAMISRSLWNAFDIEIEKGEPVTEQNKEECLVYLGYNLRNTADLGSSFELGRSFRVAGTLKKNTYVPDQDFLFINNSIDVGLSLELNSTISLDNLILLVVPDGKPSQVQMISWNEGYTVEDVEEQIRGVTDPLDLPINISFLEDKMAADLAFNKALAKPLTQIGTVVGISALLLIFCTQLLTVLQKKNDLGILLSQGFSKMSLYRILLFENVIPITIAAFFSPLLIRDAFDFRHLGPLVKEMFWKISFPPVFLATVILLIVLSFLSSYVIIRLVTATSAASLLKGELKASRYIYIGLFFLSFVLSVSLLYYGLYFIEKTENVKRVRLREKSQVVIATIDDPKLSEIQEWKDRTEQGLLPKWLFLDTTSPINRRSFYQTVMVVLNSENKPEYPLKTGFYPDIERYRGIPACVIGEGLKSETYWENGKEYLMIHHIPFEVTGVLQSWHVLDYDFRILVYADLLPEPLWEEMALRDYIGIGYSPMNEPTEEDQKRFLEILQDIFGDRIEYVGEIDCLHYDPSSDEIAKLYRVVYSTLIIISLVNLVLIALLWGVRQKLNHMIMVVNGYSRIRILFLDLITILKVEGIAIGCVLLGVLCIGLLSGDLWQMMMPIVHQVRVWLLLIPAFGFLAAFAAVFRLPFEKPSVVLKHTE